MSTRLTWRTPAGVSEYQPYWTVRIEWQEHGRTQWHPTEPTGPFSVLHRGAFPDRDTACRWASRALGPGNWMAIEVPV